MHWLRSFVAQIKIIYLTYLRDRLIEIATQKNALPDDTRWVEMVKEKQKRINMNDMATLVAIKEQGTYEMNIAQIKQVLRIFLEELATYEDEYILELMKRYRDEKEQRS